LILVLSTVLLLSGTNFYKIRAAPIVFPYGVESGDVTSDSAVLWTKVDRAASLNVEVSTNEINFDSPYLVVKRTVPATADHDFTLKTTITSLHPGTYYYYRWSEGATFSEVGRFMTAPSETQATNLMFSWSGDTDPSKDSAGQPYFGPWHVTDRLFTENNDFFIYLGDVIYSDFRGNTGKKPPTFSDAKSLPEFRQLYKDQKSLLPTRSLTDIPLYALWDDHEVKSDWAGQTILKKPTDKSRYITGTQTFNEYMPIREPWTGVYDPSSCAGPTQYRMIHWGSTMDMIILDTRSCRSESAENDCLGPADSKTGKSYPDVSPLLPQGTRDFFGLKKVSEKCKAAIEDSSRTILGAKQLDQFEKDLKNSKAKIIFVITSVNIQQSYASPYDSWEGYPAERTKILNYIAVNKINEISHVIFLSTDTHLNLINKVFDPITKSEVAREIVAGPIAALTAEDRLKAQSTPALDLLGAQKYVLTHVVDPHPDCVNLNTRSYGRVILNDPATGQLEISLRDKDGNVIKDELRAGKSCTIMIPLS
jgi:phosphodiesterase/alkaline phosphatase D-like protein